MKKILPWVFLSALAAFLIAWGVMGVKLFSNRCPHCGKLRQTMGAYCSYCGKKID